MPGRHEVASPESITTALPNLGWTSRLVIMDSGLALCAPRNDNKPAWQPLRSSAKIGPRVRTDAHATEVPP
jgi:hypothetical protein